MIVRKLSKNFLDEKIRRKMKLSGLISSYFKC